MTQSRPSERCPLKRLLMVLACVLLVLACPKVAWAAEDYFERDGEWTYLPNGDGTATVMSYEGDDTQIVVPTQVGGLTVTSVSLERSPGFDRISVVELPRTLTRLERHAFYDMPQLTSVIIDSDGLTSIPEGCFEYCRSLTSFTIPANVTTVGDYAFAYCDKLESVTFQDVSHTSSLGAFAFLDCTALRTIECPTSLTWIAQGAFDGCASLEEVVLLSTVKYGLEPFHGCTGMKRFIFMVYKGYDEPDLSKLGFSSETEKYGFSLDELGYAHIEGVYCEASSVSIPSKIMSHYVVAISEDAFVTPATQKHVERVLFPDDDYRLTTIGLNAFRNMQKLTSITLPPSVETLEMAVFLDCPALEQVDLSQTKITTLPRDTFRNCVRLGMRDGDLKLPEGLRTIKEYAFADCIGLAYLHLPASLETIEDAALYLTYKAEYANPFNIPRLALYMPDSDQTMAIGSEFALGRNPVFSFDFKVTVGSWAEARWSVLQNTVYSKAYVPVPLTDPSVLLQVDKGPYYFCNTNVRPTLTGSRWWHVFEKDDYIVYDGNNVNASTSADVVIKGDSEKFAFEPSITLTFEIKRFPMEKMSAYPIGDVRWDGEKYQPGCTLYYDFGSGDQHQWFIALEGRDYTLSYENNVDAGTATVKAAGMGNLDDGTKQLTFDITPRSLDEATIEPIPKQVYAGMPATPTSKVTLPPLPGRSLKPTELKASLGDITWRYENNDGVGIATAHVEAKEGSSVTGKRDLTFEIVKRDLATVTVEDVDDQPYAGVAIEPDPVVAVDEDHVLTRDVDYRLSYADNTDIGTATITVTGIGSCEGTLEVPFQIVPRPVTVQAQDKTKAYGQVDPSLTATVENALDAEPVAYSLAREKGENPGTYGITAQGEERQGNYAVTFVDGTLTIQRAKLDRLVDMESVPDQTYRAEALEPALVLTHRESGATLVAGTDYTVSYKDNVGAGLASFTVTGIGNYEGTLRDGFSILPLDVSKAEFTIPFQRYHEGEASEPHPERVSVTLDDGTVLDLVEGTHYELDWTENTKPGTGQCTVRGIGDCTGAVTMPFEIRALADLRYGYVKPIPDQVYCADVPHPTLYVTLDDALLTEGVDYEYLCYSHNVGTAEVELRGLGELEGTSLGTTFQIVPRDISDATLRYHETIEWWGGYERGYSPHVTVDGRELYEWHDFTCEFENCTDVGSVATATVHGIGNYTGTVSYHYTIVPYQATVLPDDVTKGYGEEDPELTASLEYGLYGNDTVDYTLVREPGEDVGTYAITTQGERWQGNYELVTEATGTFTITRGDLSDAVVTAQDMTYEGVALQPGVRVTLNGKELVAGVDYEVSGYEDNVDVGTGTVTITGTGNYEGTASGTFAIAPRPVVVTADKLTKEFGQADPKLTATVGGTVGSDAVDYDLSREPGEDVGTYAIKATGDANQGNYMVRFVDGSLEIVSTSLAAAQVAADGVTYDGEAWEPEPTVVLGDRTLVAGKDFEVVKYKDNVNVGAATIVVAGKGAYEGQATGTFAIAPHDLSGSGCTVAAGIGIWTGDPLEPTPTVSVSGRNGATLTLQADRDYRVTGYEDNVNGPVATVRIEGMGNYVGTNAGSFNITSDSNLELGSIEPIADQTYTGGHIQPRVKVSLDGVDLLLREGVDYEVTYRNNVNVGIASVVVKGLGDITGALDTTFRIVSSDLSEASVAADDCVYDGMPQEPKLTVTLEGHTLPDTDYKATYKDNVSAGTGTVTITGTGNYEGTASGTFAIAPRPVVVTADKLTKEFGQADPKLTATVGGTVGSDAVDYDLSREPGEDVGTYAVTVTGDEDQGNYAVSFVPGTLSITPTNLSEAVVSAQKQAYTGAPLTPAPTVTLGDKILVEGVDYEVTGYADNVAAGTASVRVRGIGNYKGSAQGSFAIAPRPVTEVDVAPLSPLTYNGMRQEPRPTVTDGTRKLVRGRDYQLSYDNNLKVGTARVVVKGMGNYGGTTTVEFAIERRPVVVTARDCARAYGEKDPSLEADVDGVVDEYLVLYDLAREPGDDVGTYAITASGPAEQGNYTVSFAPGTLTISEASLVSAQVTAADRAYTGGAHEPRPTVMLGEKKLVEDRDYTVSYLNNVRAGNATVVVTGAGNYAGKAAGTFEIERAVLTVHTASATKPYDGTPLVAREARVDGLVKGEAVTIAARGSLTEMGDTPNTYDLAWGSTYAGNYQLREDLGTLSVTANDTEVVLTAGSDAKTYDGTPLVCSEVGVDGLPAGFTVDATTRGSQTDVGTGDNVVADGYVIRNAVGEDRTSCFSRVRTVGGSLEVTRRPVVLTSPDATKAYDGTPLVMRGVKEGGEGFAPGEGARYTVSGSQLLPGSSTNGFSYELMAGTSASNYDIKTAEGTLTVTDRPEGDRYRIEVASRTSEVAYNGRRQTLEGFEALEFDIPVGDLTVPYVVEGLAASVSATVVGSYDNAITGDAVVRDADGNDVTSQFDVSLATGTLTIKPADLSAAQVSVDDQTYTGAPLTPTPTVTLGGATLAEGVDYTVSYQDNIEVGIATIAITGVGNYVGQAVGRFAISSEEPAKASYYLAKGDGQAVVRGTGAAAEFTIKRNVDDETTIAHFAKLQIDGRDVPASSYDVRKGSAIVTLRPALLDTLSDGKHTLTAVFDDGEATGAFTVRASGSDNGGGDKEPGGSPETPAQPTKPSATTTVPRTGDTAVPPSVLLAIALGGVAALVAGLWLRKGK